MNRPPTCRIKFEFHIQLPSWRNAKDLRQFLKGGMRQSLCLFVCNIFILRVLARIFEAKLPHAPCYWEIRIGRSSTSPRGRGAGLPEVTTKSFYYLRRAKHIVLPQSTAHSGSTKVISMQTTMCLLFFPSHLATLTEGLSYTRLLCAREVAHPPLSPVSLCIPAL